MNDELLALARTLTEKGILVDFKQNSIFAVQSLPDVKLDMKQAIISEITKKVTNDVILFREKINPALDEYIKLISDEIGRLKPDNEILKYTIKEANIPEIVSHLSEKYTGLKGMLPDNVSFSFTIPAPDMIAQCFLPTGGEDRIKAEEFINTFSPAALAEFWSKYLVSFNTTNKAISKLLNGTYDNVKDAALLVLALGYLVDRKPGYISMEDSTYAKLLNDSIKELKGGMNLAMIKYDDDVKMKKVIVDFPDQYTVVVNDTAYSEYLATDGKVEIVYGALIKGDAPALDMYINGLRANAPVYERIWGDKYRLASLAAMTKNIETHRLVHILCVNRFLTEILPKDLESMVKVDAGSVERMLNDLFKNMEDSDILDVEKVAREVFGKICFASTNYYDFTGYMLQYLTLFKDNNVKRAAAYACLDLVIDYLFTQVQVTGA